MRIISRGNSPVHAHQSTELKRSGGALRTGAKPTLELIAHRIEGRQIGKFAEFLGQFPCRKSECQQNTKLLSTGAEPTSQIVKAEVDFRHGVTELANVGRKL